VGHVFNLQTETGLYTANGIVVHNCHYTVHRLLWNMAKGLPQPPCRAAQLAYAQQGYAACLAAGTVAHIPNEG
jgi:hypothetical protein